MIVLVEQIFRVSFLTSSSKISYIWDSVELMAVVLPNIILKFINIFDHISPN